MRTDPAPGPEEETLAGELRDVLRAAMAVLPPAQRAVLGRPVGTVKWRLHAARQRLRTALGGGEGSIAAERA